MARHGTLRLETNGGSNSSATGGDGNGLWIVCGSQYRAAWISHVDGGDSSGNTSEVVVATHISGNRNCRAGSWGQGNGYASKIRLGCILHTVAVGISKDMTRNATLGIEANWGWCRRQACRNGDTLRIITRGHDEASRASSENRNEANRDCREGVVACAIGRR